MGQKDKILYHYLSDRRRFADFVNGSQFGGQRILRSEELSGRPGRYVVEKTDPAKQADSAGKNGAKPSKRKKKKDIDMKDYFRDICMTADGKGYVQIIAVENQSYIDYSMPFRCMEYDVLEYRQQIDELIKKNRADRKGQSDGEWLSGIRETDRLIPVYTIVLYWGKEPWSGPGDLKDMMDFGENEEWKELFSNYSMHLVCINEEKDYQKYQTDLRQVIQMLQCRGDREAMQELIQQEPYYQCLPKDTYNVLAVLMHDKRLLKKRESVRVEGKEEYNMWEALTELIEEGRTEGMRRGMQRGIRKGIQKGTKFGEERGIRLSQSLMQDKRYQDMDRALKDVKYREKLYTEYGIN